MQIKKETPGYGITLKTAQELSNTVDVARMPTCTGSAASSADTLTDIPAETSPADAA